MLAQIFAADTIDFRQNYIPVATRFKPEVTRQMAVACEFAHNHAFSEANRALTKSLLEGEGGLVRDGLYAQFAKEYEDCSIILASNGLPSDNELQATDVKFDKDCWQPIRLRCTFVQMENGFDPLKDGPFPYTVTQLAFAMKLLCEHPSLM